MRQRAFTLIELLVYVGVLTIVLGIIFFFVANIIINERSIVDRVRTIDEADFAMRQMLDQARGAKNISTASQFANANNGELVLTKTDSTVTFAVDKTDAEKPKLVMTDSADPQKMRVLTSPRVAVDMFALDCIGTASSCGSDLKGVRITLGLRDIVTNQTMTITTSATPRGY